MHILITFLAGLAAGIPIGAYFWPKLASRLKSEAQKVEGTVAKFTGKGKASSK